MASLLETGVILGNGGEQFNPVSWFRACTGAASYKKKDVYSKVRWFGVVFRRKFDHLIEPFLRSVLRRTFVVE